MDVSKTRTSFYRRLYVAWLIDSGTATSVPALKLALPGRTMTSTPTKPRPTAIQRRARTCSCRNSTAAMVTKIGVE